MRLKNKVVIVTGGESGIERGACLAIAQEGVLWGTVALPTPWLPIRRAGEAKEKYGATVAFLLSDDAGYLTAANIPVDGGYLATYGLFGKPTNGSGDNRSWLLVTNR